MGAFGPELVDVIGRLDEDSPDTRDLSELLQSVSAIGAPRFLVTVHAQLG